MILTFALFIVKSITRLTSKCSSIVSLTPLSELNDRSNVFNFGILLLIAVSSRYSSILWLTFNFSSSYSSLQRKKNLCNLFCERSRIFNLIKLVEQSRKLSNSFPRNKSSVTSCISTCFWCNVKNSSFFKPFHDKSTYNVNFQFTNHCC